MLHHLLAKASSAAHICHKQSGPETALVQFCSFTFRAKDVQEHQEPDLTDVGNHSL